MNGHRHKYFSAEVVFYQGKTVFYSVQYKNGSLAASDLLYMFTQSIKIFTFYHTY